MKKQISIMIALCMLIAVIASVFAIAPTAEEAPRAKSVYLKNDEKEVAFLASADLAALCDGKKHFEYDNIANYNNPGIVLVHNVESATPQEKENWDNANVVIELDGDTLVDTVNVCFYTYWSAMIGIPNEKEITISYSVDGENFSELKQFTLEDDIKTGAHILDKYFYLDEAVTCKAIMVTMPFGEADPTWQAGWEMLEWFAFTELSAGLRLDYDNADDESSEPEVSKEPFIQAAPDYESYGYTLKATDDFFVTHFDNIGYEGASAIMTEAYTGGAWWLHIAFAPVEGEEGMFVVTATQSGIGDGLLTEPLEVPEGGFVWCTNLGNDNTSTGGINYQTATIRHAIEIGQSLEVGRVVCFENLDLEGKDIHNVNGLTTMWYDSGYVFNSKIHIMLNDGEELEPDEPSEEPSQEPSQNPESSEPDESSEIPEESETPDESEKPESSAPDTSKAPDTTDEGSFPWWIIVVVAVVAIAVVVFIIIKKKK